MVVRRVHQHADLGLKIRRIPVQNMTLLLHVDASLNTGGLVGSQGGYICGVTDKSLLEIIQDESDSTELIGRRSTSHVCGCGLCRVGKSFFCKS